MPKYLDFNSPLRNDGRTLLPILEFAVGSLALSRKQALIELGFPEEKIDELIQERYAEDLMSHPAIINTMANELNRHGRS